MDLHSFIDQPIEQCSGALVVRFDRDVPHFLATRRPLDQGGFWTSPKGHIEPGENTEECALREVYEEVGLRNVTLLGFLGAEIYSASSHGGGPEIKEVTWFLARAESDEDIRLDFETFNAAKWLSVDEARSVYSHLSFRRIFSRAVEMLAGSALSL